MQLLVKENNMNSTNKTIGSSNIIKYIENLAKYKNIKNLI